MCAKTERNYSLPFFPVMRTVIKRVIVWCSTRGVIILVVSSQSLRFHPLSLQSSEL